MGATLSPGSRAGRQVLRTRGAVLRSFSELVLERGYDQLTVRTIIEKADVGRSTFYEHFESKEQLLEQSLIRLLRVVAESLDADASSTELEHLLMHFSDQRRIARAFFAGSARPVVVKVLTDLLLATLAARIGARPEPLVPLEYIAAQIAHAQLALIDTWLVDRRVWPAARIARALQCSGAAATAALVEI